MSTKIQVCTHDDVVRHRAEPDVGLSLPYFECQSCGDTTTDWEDDSDEDGRRIVPIWTPPVWVEVPAGFYVAVQRLHPEDWEHVIIGPFDTEAAADAYLMDSIQVQALVEDDCEDAWVTDAEGAAETVADWVVDEQRWEQHLPVVEDLP